MPLRYEGAVILCGAVRRRPGSAGTQFGLMYNVTFSEGSHFAHSASGMLRAPATCLPGAVMLVTDHAAG